MTRDEQAIWDAIFPPGWWGSAKPPGYKEDNAIIARIVALVAAARREGAIAMAKRAVFAAKSACRAGEKCMDDGGCRHVPCITARMIAADIESLIAEPLAAPPQPERAP